MHLFIFCRRYKKSNQMQKDKSNQMQKEKSNQMKKEKSNQMQKEKSNQMQKEKTLLFLLRFVECSFHCIVSYV